NSTAFGDVGTFSITAQMDYIGEPFYQNRTTSILVSVRERATRLTYTPPQEIPFGDNLTIYLNYYDVDAGLVAILDAESFLSLNTINGTPVDSSYFWVEYVSGATYRLLVNTTKLDIYGRYSLSITVTGNPVSRFDDQTISVDADVRARNTQLTITPIAQTSYTQNITVTFYYTDLEADVGVYNDTSVGDIVLTLNETVSWWVSQISPGVYRLLINATDLGSTGQFGFEASFIWVSGKPYYENQTIEFIVSLTGAGSVLSYEPPQQVPIGDDIIIVLWFRDSATGQGVSNDSEFLHASITALNSTPAGPFQYIMTNPEDGKIVFTINSTPFWTSGSLFFEFDVTWTDGELPFYPDINGTVVRAIVREIFTQTLADSPNPGTVPIGDNSSV
ncbi:MAG: hypothetical protein P1Q69_21415, partial [Candidatus Thorarchaeota archaeon]|nr:hypothetical protein [Candidatus Thorarchaeota archaeon]